jgi:tRNA (guanine-N7-)-methyltransferase
MPSSSAERAFFGRRKGPALRPHQAQLLQTLLPQLSLDLNQPFKPEEVFSWRPKTLCLEIGFGGGEHLLAQAQTAPEVGFIGCEPFTNGMAKALAAISATGISNVRLHFGDAVELLAWLPADSLARIDLLYPDPWPKRRHWKRRFVQPVRIAEFARILRPGGEFRFASDWPPYVAWTLALISRSEAFEWTAERPADWRSPWPGYQRTRYEAKAIREGRRPCYLTFRRL